MMCRSPATAVLLFTVVFAALVDAGPWCECPDGFTPRYVAKRPHCWCYKFARDLASWAEAKVYCGVMRAWMMEVKEATTQSWLKHRLYDSRDTYASYVKWLPSEPDNYLGYQNCLAIRQRCSDDVDCVDYGWFDDDCYQKKFYICETSGILRGVPTTKRPPVDETNVNVKQARRPA
ncbi:hypothetical protein LSAT2_013090 [Lamellibrachia satsuma]|nr:hypothetical protein LSAT2_013090 [Lamellibrachia satsuma]